MRWIWRNAFLSYLVGDGTDHINWGDVWNQQCHFCRGAGVLSHCAFSSSFSFWARTCFNFSISRLHETFLICFLLLLLMQVMYDATGVRLHAGKQASVLNMIITELPPDHPVSSSTAQLKDTLGHTPLQVAVGAIVGILVGYIIGLLYR